MDTYMTAEYNFGKDLFEALPVLKEINDLYNFGESLRQRTAVRQTNQKTNNTRYARLKAALVSLILYAVLSLILDVIIVPIAYKTGFRILTLLYSIVGVGVCIYVYFYLKKIFSAHKPVETTEDITAGKQLEKISERILEISTENCEVLERIPADYRCYDAVLFMERAARNGRADNMKEAINLYEEDLHRRRLETNSAVAIHMQQEQCKMLSDIEYNSHRAAVNSGIAATFSVLSYLGRS